MVYTERPLSLGKSGTLLHGRQRVPVESAPSNNSGHWVPSELPCVATGHVAGGNTNILWDSTGKGLSAACAWFPLDFIPCTSFLCCLTLCLFTVKKIIAVSATGCQILGALPANRWPWGQLWGPQHGGWQMNTTRFFWKVQILDRSPKDILGCLWLSRMEKCWVKQSEVRIFQKIKHLWGLLIS